MKKKFRPASLLFNFLTLLVFFILGLLYAGLIDAGKNQGLAGGAIVFWWGVLFAGVAFIISFFVTHKVKHKKIVIGNWILFLVLLTGYGIFHYRYVQRQKLKEKENQPYEKQPVTPTTSVNKASLFSFTTEKKIKETTLQNVDNHPMGLGLFSPNYFENQVLYFYGNPNLEKSLMEHSPYDSITFKRNEYNAYEIATAPPWLVPEHLKMDYDLLYFKIESLTEEFVEVVVNSTNQQTAYVSKYAGETIFWPEFLLGVNTLEFRQNSNRKVRARPFAHASEINTPYQFMKPLKIKGDWAEALLLDENFKKVGKGWIRWRECGKLLVNYSLLS